MPSWHLNVWLVKHLAILAISSQQEIIGVTERMTRSSQLLNIPLYKSNANQRTLYYCIENIWNNLDTPLKTSKSIFSFKFYPKNKLITDFLNSSDL